MSLLLSGSLLALAVPASANSGGALAPADDSSASQRGSTMPAPIDAFELTLSFGYSHASGSVEGGTSFAELGADGGAFELGLGWRVTPQLSVGAYGSLTRFERGSGTPSGTEVARIAGGVQATWHLAPFQAVDPWIQLGTGWHAYLVSPDRQDGTVYQGLDLVRVQVGTDFRVSPTVAIAPVLGVEVSTFLRAYRDDDDATYDELNARLSVFFFAGVSGRFDLGGATVTPRPTTYARR
jgi:hypothetical protein